ncbi:MAG: hypothetical protein M1835_001441, partial [Candelina submexicana]
MFERIPNLKLAAYQPGRALFRSVEALSWNQRDLQEMLNQALTEILVNICFLIDGLDEYEGNMIELLEFFRKLATSGAGRVKICLASRPEPLISQRLETCPGFRMQSFNLEGIGQYVSVTMQNVLTSTSDIETTRLLSDDLAERAQGVFLWARFAISELILGVSDGDDLQELQDRLRQFPPNLEQLYDRIFNKMSLEAREFASLMFRLVYFKIGHLSAQALTSAMDIAFDKKISYDGLLDRPTVERLRKRVMVRSGGLLEIVRVPCHRGAWSRNLGDNSGALGEHVKYTGNSSPAASDIDEGID